MSIIVDEMRRRPQVQTERCQMIAASFSEAYFGHVPVQMAMWGEIERYFDSYFLENASKRQLLLADIERIQKALAYILQTHPLNAFPVSPKFRSEVIQWLNRLLDRHDIPVLTSSEFYDIMENEEKRDSSLIKEPEFIFKTFIRHGCAVTLLEENREFIGHGTTGLTSWQGALFLTEWCHSFSHLLQNKNILELGSGTGLLGISLLKKIKVQSYTFTDCHWRVINALIHNLKLNFSSKSAGDSNVLQRQTESGPPTLVQEDNVQDISYCQKLSEGVEARVRHLDWTDYDNIDIRGIDVILGSDIVYERTLLPPLCKVIRRVLLSSGVECAKAFIACTERSFTTLSCFERALLEHNLKFEVIQRALCHPTETILTCDVQHQPIRLYSIILK